MIRTIARLVACVSLSVLVPATARAQAVSTAAIAGTVRDASGGVLPGVSVTATQTDIGLIRSVVSDDMGGYTITSLPVGPYRLEFSLQGFRTAVKTGIVLQVNTNPTINATLELGDLTETIQVEAASGLIETPTQELDPNGTYGTIPIDAIQGPGRWNVDMGLSRAIRIGAQQVQLRWEVFNVFNATINSSTRQFVDSSIS